MTWKFCRASEVSNKNMPVDNGLATQPRRGRAITVRTPGRHTYVEATAAPVLDDPTVEPVEDDLLELEEDLDELEERPVPDDSEELEMWMRQTRRAQLL